MTQSPEQLVGSLDSLTLQSFEAFCEDISSMFGNTAECTPDSTGQAALSELKREFKKLAAVNRVQAKGLLDGSFRILLDQAGLFVLAGVFVMLPEKRVLETIRGGTLKDADYINDAIKEVGNLLVGSWDRIFREELKGHKHFKQTDTFVGSIWDDPEAHIGLAAEQRCRYVICRMKVDDFPEFKCAAVFPDTLFEEQDEPAQPEQPDEQAETARPSESAQIEPEPAAKTDPTDTTDEAEHATSENAQPVSDDASTNDTEPTERSETTMQTAAEDAEPGPVAKAIEQLTRQNADTPEKNAESTRHHLPSLTAAEIMNPAVLWLEPEDTVEETLAQMQRHNAGYVLIGRDGRIEGLVSRSDLAAAISPYLRPVFAHWRRPVDDATMKIRIKWFMSRTVHTIGPDASLTKIMHTMMQHSVRGLPVMDANGAILGLVTVYDVFAAVLNCTGLQLTGRPQQAPPGVQSIGT